MRQAIQSPDSSFKLPYSSINIIPPIKASWTKISTDQTTSKSLDFVHIGTHFEIRILMILGMVETHE